MDDFNALPKQFREIKNKLTGIQNKILFQHGVSPVMMYTLELLLKHPHYIAVDIAGEVGLTRGAVTQLLDKLENQGLVHRRPHPTSRRSLQIEVSEQGRLLAERILGEYDTEIKKLFTGFSSKEASELGLLLSKLFA